MHHALANALQAEHFRPFRIYLAGGQSFLIVSPSLTRLDGDQLHLLTERVDRIRNLDHHIAVVAVASITVIEPESDEAF